MEPQTRIGLGLTGFHGPLLPMGDHGDPRGRADRRDPDGTPPSPQRATPDARAGDRLPTAGLHRRCGPGLRHTRLPGVAYCLTVRPIPRGKRGKMVFYTIPPDTAPKTVEVTVASGDTLSAIATRNNTTWQAIFDDNKGHPQATHGALADPNRIYPGWKLTLHAPAQPQLPAAQPIGELGKTPSALLAGVRSALGIPYHWGGTTTAGFDCSGLVQWAFAKVGVKLPRTSQAQAGAGTPVSLGNIAPGDLVIYYPGATHIGVYVGEGQIIHAPRPGKRVELAPLRSMPIHSVRRVLAGIPAGSPTVPAVQASSTLTLSSPIAALKAYARTLVPADQWPALEAIITRESGWNPGATNRTSGAYGLGQALPADKMSSAGPSWRTDPAVQLRWTVAYINTRYGSPAKAWAFWLARGWY